MTDLSDTNLKLSVAYVWSVEYCKRSDQCGKVRGRASLVHSLAHSYGLLGSLNIVSPRMATKSELESFHSADYVECIRSISEESAEFDEETLDEYGLGYDCPVKTGTFSYASMCAGASIVAAEALMSGKAKIAINWGGGWHHARKDQSAGFCYFNDIVLAILKLRQSYDRILYIDIDIHHGDGVEQSFWFSDRVLTLSFHQYSPGFFPGTGSSSDIGQGRGRHFALNIPLGVGCRDEEYCRVFDVITAKTLKAFAPSCVVMQCGADCLVGDPLGGFNLTLDAPRHCVRTVLDWGLPTLLLGGGGYHAANTARLWSSLTAEAIGQGISDDIPDDCPRFTEFGPDYRLGLDPMTGPSRNSPEALARIVKTAEAQLQLVEAKVAP